MSERPSFKVNTKKSRLYELGTATLLAAMNVSSDERMEAARARQEQHTQEAIRRTQVAPEERRTDPVERRFHPSRTRPILAHLREEKVFLEREMWATTASSQAFHRLGAELADSPETNQLLDQREVRLMVPASGELLSPLEMGFQLAERSPVLERLQMTGTEIDETLFVQWEQRLREMAEAIEGIEDLTVRVEEHPEYAAQPANRPRKKIVTWNYRAENGRRVLFQLELELGMSGERYMRPELANQADLLILHDINRGPSDSFATASAGDLFTVLTESTTQTGRRPRYVVIEQSPLEPYSLNGIGRVRLNIQGERYGCGENHLAPDRHNAPAYGLDRPPRSSILVIELQTELLQVLGRPENRLLAEVYTALLVPAEFERRLVLDEEGFTHQVRMAQRALHTVSNRMVKQAFREAARHLTLQEASSSALTEDAELRRAYQTLRPSLLAFARE